MELHHPPTNSTTTPEWVIFWFTHELMSLVTSYCLLFEVAFAGFFSSQR